MASDLVREKLDHSYVVSVSDCDLTVRAELSIINTPPSLETNVSISILLFRSCFVLSSRAFTIARHGNKWLVLDEVNSGGGGGGKSRSG